MSYHVPAAATPRRQLRLKRALQIIGGLIGGDFSLDLILWATQAPLKGALNTYMGRPRLVVQGLLLLAALAVLLGMGIQAYHLSAANHNAHWTRDQELLFWRQKRPRVQEWNWLDWLMHLALLIVPLLLLALVLCFWLVTPRSQLFILIFFGVIIPAQLVGINFASWALSAKQLIAVTLVDSGVIQFYMFHPWPTLAGYVVDHAKQQICIFLSPTSGDVIALLQPPDEEHFRQSLAIVSAQLPELTPEQMPGLKAGRRKGYLLFTAYLLAGLIVAGTLLSLPSRTLACILASISAAACIKLPAGIIAEVLGANVARMAGQGLTLSTEAQDQGRSNRGGA
jgi:hypothetical protein